MIYIYIYVYIYIYIHIHISLSILQIIGRNPGLLLGQLGRHGPLELLRLGILRLALVCWGKSSYNNI